MSGKEAPQHVSDVKWIEIIKPKMIENRLHFQNIIIVLLKYLTYYLWYIVCILYCTLLTLPSVLQSSIFINTFRNIFIQNYKVASDILLYLYIPTLYCKYKMMYSK